MVLAQTRFCQKMKAEGENYQILFKNREMFLKTKFSGKYTCVPPHRSFKVSCMHGISNPHYKTLVICTLDMFQSFFSMIRFPSFLTLDDYSAFFFSEGKLQLYTENKKRFSERYVFLCDGAIIVCKPMVS